MPLAMSRPWKHPDSGVYWFRRGVPADLRALVGKREEKRSLQTKDPAVAKKRHAEALAEVETRWANLRTGPQSLTEREAHEIAAPWHDRWLATYKDNPSAQTTWRVDLEDRLWVAPSAATTLSVNFLSEVNADESKLRNMENWCRAGARECLKSNGLAVDAGSELTLAKALSFAIQRASLTLARYAKGEFGIGPQSSNSWHIGVAASELTKSVSLTELFKGWSTERQPAAKTLYEWKRVLQTLAVFLGHDDAGKMSSEDLIRWKASMVDAGLKSRTIQNAKLAPVRAVLQWGVDNRKLANNPAHRVTIEVKSIATERKRSFTDEEAKVILAASLREKDTVKRWVPWLGAYSGARVSELCQLRVDDVIEVDGIWCMKFDPEAGPLKNSSSERTIPLHPALIDVGFLIFVKGIKKGPLFPHLTPDKFGKRGGNGTKVIGRFVRSLGITDTRLSPSHSWRHRIKTQGRRHGLAKDILEAITGHGRKTVADSYGEFPVEALLRELSKIPALVL
jgi:integrase